MYLGLQITEGGTEHAPSSWSEAGGRRVMMMMMEQTETEVHLKGKEYERPALTRILGTTGGGKVDGTGTGRSPTAICSVESSHFCTESQSEFVSWLRCAMSSTIVCSAVKNIYMNT
jgi:hypothetical protein